MHASDERLEQVLAVVQEQVRDGVRARGIDPQRQPDEVRALVDEALAQVAADRPEGAEPGIGDLGRQVFSAVAGFGPLQDFLDDPEVEELWINEPGRVFVARHGRSELTTLVLDVREVRDLVERMLRLSGRRLDLSHPFVDAMLPDGSRLHVVIPDITRQHWAVNVRKFVVRPRGLDELIDRDMLTRSAAAFLEASVVSGLNIVVAGGTQSGKTTFVNALLGAVPGRERIITCEEVFELRLDHPDWVALQTRDAGLEGTGAVPLRQLVREALRMRPTRLVVGEVRQAESLDLLVAMNSGMPAMATIHANSAREAVTKLCTLPLLAGENITADFIVPTVAGCVDVVVHLGTAPTGDRRVQQISSLSGRVEEGVVEMSDVYTRREGVLLRGSGFAPHADRFRLHGYDVAELLSPEVAA